MNRVINWVFGSFFRTLGRFLFYLGIAVLIGWLMNEFGLFLTVNAKTLTSYNHAHDLINNNACGVADWYSYSTTGGSEILTGKVNTSYTVTPDALYFDFNEDLTSNTYYDIKINAMHSNFNQNIGISNIKVANGNSCGSIANSNISVVSISKSATSGIYKTLTIRIFSATAIDYWTLNILGDSFISSGSEFGVSSLSIDEVDMDNTDAILNNNNSNTDSIINNQNQNNEELKDTIDKNFNSCRESYNLFPGWIIGTGINNSTGAITTNSNYASSSDYIAVDFSINSSYFLSGLSNDLRTFVAAYNSNKEFLGRTGASYINSISLASNSFSSGTAQGTGNIAYIRVTSYLSSDSTGSISQVNNLKTMLNVGSSALDYEEYGKEICKNKLDSVTDSVDNLTGAITDSSSPDISGFGDAAGWLPPGPLDSIVNLPITFFSTLLYKFGGTCSPIVVDLPFVNVKMTLPCASEIYSQLGSFSTWWEAFGAILSAWCLYKYFINLYKWVEDALTLKEQKTLGKWGGI